MGRRTRQTFFQRGNAYGRQAHEEILNITSRQGNTHQTTMKYHLTSARMAVIKKEHSKYWQRCGEKGSLMHR